MKSIWDAIVSFFTAIADWFSSWFGPSEPSDRETQGQGSNRDEANAGEEQNVSQEVTPEKEQATQQPYRLVVRRVGSDEANEAKGQSNEVVNIEMLIVDAEGKVVSVNGREARFTGRTGGFGKGALPGLEADLDGNGQNGANATYAFQHGNADIQVSDQGQPYNYADAEGFFQRMVSPDYVQRGLQSDKLDQIGAFGIHPDGQSRDGTVINDGSEGCLVIDTAQARSYADMYNAIPKHLRPTAVEVVPARGASLAQARAAGDNIRSSGAGDLQTADAPNAPSEALAARAQQGANVTV